MPLINLFSKAKDLLGSTVFSKDWWKETAWAKIKHNAIDAGMMIFFEVASVVMSVSTNFLSITISTEVARALTCILASSSIAASLLADWQHTGEKRDTFDKLTTQVTFVENQPTKPTEFSRRFGLTLSVIGVFGYVGCFVLGLPPAAEWACISFGVLSCHVGRKYYDMKLGAGLATMKREVDKILEISGLRNSDEAGQRQAQLASLVQLRARYKDLITTVERFSREAGITPAQQDLLSKVVSDERSSTTYISEALGSSEESVEPFSHHEVARDTERQVPDEDLSPHPHLQMRISKG